MNPSQDPSANPDAAPLAPTPETPSTPVTDPFAPTQPVVTPEPVASAAEPSSFASPVTAEAPIAPAAATPVTPPVQAAPFAPTAPAAPAAPTITGAPVDPASPFTQPAPGAPAPKPKNTKKIILIAGIIGGVVLLAVVGVVIYLLLTSVSKQDYADAAKQYNEVSSAATALSSASLTTTSLSSSTDSEFTKDTQEIKDEIAKVNTEIDDLGKLKAVRVGEGGKLFTEFKTKANGYTSYYAGLVSSFETVRPAFVICNKQNDATTQAEILSTGKACVEALNKSGDIANPEFKTFYDSLKTEFPKIIAAREGVAALTSPYGSQYEQYKTYRDQVYDAQDKVTAAQKAYVKAVNDKIDELNPTDASKALRDYLNEQQRK